MHPAIEHVLQFFEYNHLEGDARTVSARFYHLANELVHQLPGNPETTACLRKLLEAKDCAVRSVIAGEPNYGEDS